jgi:hypothetical protein
MPRHVVVVDRREDFPWEAHDRRVVTARDYVDQTVGEPAITPRCWPRRAASG